MTSRTNKSVNMVVEIEWTEIERGWGQRPDGFTYYWTMDQAKADIDAYWSRMPELVPEEYSRPDDPKFVTVDPVFALLVHGRGKVYSDKSCKIL